MHAPCALESNAKSSVSILALGYTTISKKKDGSDGGIPARNIAGIKLPLNPFKRIGAAWELQRFAREACSLKLKFSEVQNSLTVLLA
jgi:ribosome-associated toxin RatA of RatAB toxin-antitoxin module